MIDKNMDLEKILNSDIDVPSSISPENIEEKLMKMTAEELEKRKGSGDVPDDEALDKEEIEELDKNALEKDVSNSENKKAQVSGKNSKVTEAYKKRKQSTYVAVPLLVAACVVIVFSLSLKLRKKDNVITESTEETIQIADDNDVDGEDEPIVTGGYETDFGESYEIENQNYYEAYSLLERYIEANEYYYASVSQSLDETSDDNPIEESSGITFTDTNVNAEGVQGGDLVKSDGRFIYEYINKHINIYSINEGNVDKASTINVNTDLPEFEDFGGMYIAGDKLILSGSYDSERIEGEYRTIIKSQTDILIYDISDRTNPLMIKVLSQDGRYKDSRMIGNVLYTVSDHYIYPEQLDPANPVTYIPSVDGELLEDEDIYVERKSNTCTFKVVTSVDINSCDFKDRLGLMGGTDSIYVSLSNMFFIDREYDWDNQQNLDESSIVRASLADGNMNVEAEGTFSGYLRDEYSIDEYDGNIRLVAAFSDQGNNEILNGLYVLNSDLELVGEAKDFEEGEALGFINVPGVSTYLQPYGDGLLLGVGYEGGKNKTTGKVKLSMFDISNPSDVKELDELVIEDMYRCSVVEDRNAFMFDSESGKFGFVVSNRKDIDSYQVYSYDETNGFVNLYEEIVNPYNTDNVRGLIIGEYFYLVNQGKNIYSYDLSYNLVEEYTE
jgi:uncharacterized secreted protein with C-terminal beta-propeller domain